MREQGCKLGTRCAQTGLEKTHQGPNLLWLSESLFFYCLMMAPLVGDGA